MPHAPHWLSPRGCLQADYPFAVVVHGLAPTSGSALITWLLPHWREAEPHVFAFLDRAKHDSIREAGGVHGRQIDPLPSSVCATARPFFRLSSYPLLDWFWYGGRRINARTSLPEPPCPMSE